MHKNNSFANRYLVSIIIATRNAEEQISECLDSVKKYAPENVEIVIVDGGSEDGTLSILTQYGISNFISEKDQGIYDAFNKGIRRANGQWFYFLGSDDRLLPGFGNMLQNLKEIHTIYYGNTEAIYLENRTIPYHLLSGKFDKYRLAKYPVNHQTVFYPASVFEKYSYDIRYRVFADYALNLQLWGDRQFKIQYIPVKVALYNMTGFSSSLVDETFKNDKSSLIRKNLGLAVWLRYRFKKFKKQMKGEDWY